MEDGNITEVRAGKQIVLTMTYENGYRIIKEGTDYCTFEYKSGKLVKKIINGINISYLYDFDDNYRIMLSGFLIEDKPYTYMWDSEKRICGIQNENHELIAKYLYDGLILTNVLEKKGEAWDGITVLILSGSNDIYIDVIYKVIYNDTVFTFYGDSPGFSWSASIYYVDINNDGNKQK